MSDMKTALDDKILRSNLRGEVRALLTDDAILIRLMAAQQRYQSACAAGYDPDGIIDDALADVETWLRGAEQLEQLAADRQWLTDRAQAMAAQRDGIDGDEIPF